MKFGEFCCIIASTIPKFLCTVLFVWSYYTIIFKIAFTPLISNPITSIYIFFHFTILVLTCILLYYLIIMVGPGSPTDHPALCVFGYQTGDSITPPTTLTSKSVMVKENGQFRFCNKCKAWKPDRCHHCSSCNKCILKMDHHCPWFATCIGFNNHKFFVQFLIYTTIYLGSLFVVSGGIMYEMFAGYSDPTGDSSEYFSLHIMFVLLLSMVFGISVLVFTLFTIYQVLKNKTTIESYEYQRYKKIQNSNSVGNVFDLGYKKNWRSVMGNSPLEWILPIKVKSNLLYNDGLGYEVNNVIYQKLQQQDDLQQRLSSELLNYRNNQLRIQQDALNEMMNNNRDYLV